MGEKDIQTMSYLSDCAHFADMFNAAFFCGEEVIKADQLEDDNKEMVDDQLGKGGRVNHDNVKKWVHNVKLAILVIENQSHIDYHMAIRNMYAESLYYRNQWKGLKEEHKRKGDLKKGDEFISGMKAEEKFTPALYLVVYFGEEPWQGPRTLHELLDFTDENERIRPYISDYRLNIFDYHDYDSFEQFKTELQTVFEFMRYAKEKDALRKMVAAHPENYYNVSNDTYQLIATLTNSKELLIHEEQCDNDEGGKNMCKALEDIRLEGLEEGIERGIKEGIKDGEALLATLLNHLLADNRMEDVRLATTDEEARKRFYKEYGMID